VTAPFDPAAMYEAVRPHLAQINAEIEASPEGVEKDILHKLHSEIHDAVMTGYLLAKIRRPVSAFDRLPPARPVEQFRCAFTYDNDSECSRPATLVAPDGTRHCNWHAPLDVELTISEHDDQRAVAE
jgi:hypothetical protein